VAPLARLSPEDRADLARQLTAEVRRAIAAGLSAAATPAQVSPAIALPAPASGIGTPSTPETDAGGAAAAISPPAVAPSSIPALQSARAVVQAAVARGAWRTDDADALRASLASLSNHDAVDVLRELSRAINTGRVQLADLHRPLL
jgi:hypothetical protein